MADQVIITSEMYYEELPGVCESGEECRALIYASTHAAVTEEFMLAFTNMRKEFENGILRSGPHLESGYAQAVECDPGCGPDCSEVEVELSNVYDEMLRIMDEIRVLQEEQFTALETITQIETMCPAFADMSDAEIATYADEQMATY